MSMRSMKGRPRSSEAGSLPSPLPSGQGVGGRSRKMEGEMGSAGSATKSSGEAAMAARLGSLGWVG